MRALLLAFLLLAPVAAQAGFFDNGPPAGAGGGGGATGAAAITSGTITGTSVNGIASAGQFQWNGLNALQFSRATNEWSTFLGPYAGASADLTQSQFILGIGPNTFESYTGLTGESVAIGPNSQISATTSGGSVSIGISTCSSETVNGNNVCIGNDAMRDIWDGGGNVVVGTGAYGDGGNGTNGPNYVYGNSALAGSASTLTLAGTFTVGDVYTFTITTANACGTINCTTGSFPVSKTYTVVTSDTAAIIAAKLATSLTNWGIDYTLGDGQAESLHSLFNVGFQLADVTNHPTVLKGHYPSSWQLSVATSCTGTCGGTITVGAGFTGSNNFLAGNSVFGYFGNTTSSFNTIVGMGAIASKFVTVATNDTFMGYGIAVNMTTASNDTVIGSGAGAGLTSGNRNTLFGANSGGGITTGTGNTVLGEQALAGQTCITSGGTNLSIGSGSCVASPTSSNQMSIANMIYGTGLSGTGATVSPGRIGIGTNAPNAAFVIGSSGGTNNDGHIGFTGAAPAISGCTGCTLDATASDAAGTLTEGTSQTGFVLTFAIAYATAPHCVVTSPTGAAFTSYTTATTTLTVVNASQTASKYTYQCVQ